jgi:hypothetical protein
MIHRLTLGYLDPNAVVKGQTIVLRSLDMNLVQELLQEIGEVNEKGQVTLGGLPVQIDKDTVVCPWLVPGHNRKAEQFARRLTEETGCLMADIGSRKIVTVEAFLDHTSHAPVVPGLEEIGQDVQDLN